MIASVPLVAGVLLLGWRPQPTVPVDERAYVATTVAVGGGERAAALQLYAAGQFPGACERFSRAAADNPKSPVWRQDVARCFEASRGLILRRLIWPAILKSEPFSTGSRTRNMYFCTCHITSPGICARR